jgi:hypothetical protein
MKKKKIKKINSFPSLNGNIDSELEKKDEEFAKMVDQGELIVEDDDIEEEKIDPDKIFEFHD